MGVSIYDIAKSFLGMDCRLLNVLAGAVTVHCAVSGKFK